MSSRRTAQRHARKIEAGRKEVQEAFALLGRSVERELSVMPRGRRWLLPTVAFAVGVALSGAGGKESRPLPASSEADAP
ncbi:MAG: hypothetical protein AAF725_06030 [Acidobacteriota bacterium]